LTPAKERLNDVALNDRLAAGYMDYCCGGFPVFFAWAGLFRHTPLQKRSEKDDGAC
jgi:hypothetical protein